MDNNLVEIYNKNKKALKEEKKLFANLDIMKERHDKEVREISNRHKQEREQIVAEIKKNEENKSALYNKLWKMYNEIHNVNGYEFAPRMQLSSGLIEGQEISTYEYFKNELEKMTGKELTLYMFSTPYTEKVEEIEDYETYVVTKRMIDTILMPKDVVETIYNKSQQIHILDYYKLIKKLPFVFLLQRVSVEDHSKKSELKEEYEYNIDFSIGFNNYKKEDNKGIFERDEYNKNNTGFEKIVLSTFEYWHKSKMYEKYLQEKREINQKLKEMEKEHKRLIEKQKELNNFDKQGGIW